MQKFEYKIISGCKTHMEKSINALVQDDWLLDKFFYSGEYEQFTETEYTALLKRLI